MAAPYLHSRGAQHLGWAVEALPHSIRYSISPCYLGIRASLATYTECGLCCYSSVLISQRQCRFLKCRVADAGLGGGGESVAFRSGYIRL